jgi:hypothetical protein
MRRVEVTRCEVGVEFKGNKESEIDADNDFHFKITHHVA